MFLRKVVFSVHAMFHVYAWAIFKSGNGECGNGNGNGNGEWGMGNWELGTGNL